MHHHQHTQTKETLGNNIHPSCSSFPSIHLVFLFSLSLILGSLSLFSCSSYPMSTENLSASCLHSGPTSNKTHDFPTDRTESRFNVRRHLSLTLGNSMSIYIYSLFQFASSRHSLVLVLTSIFEAIVVIALEAVIFAKFIQHQYVNDSTKRSNTKSMLVPTRN